MKNKPHVPLLLVCCLAIGFSDCFASDGRSTTLTVEKIDFIREKSGRETVALICNRSCVPEIFTLEEDRPRVVMDMKDVFRIGTRKRSVNTGGRLVNRVRSYLDKQTGNLRVVLDMEPTKYCTVQPMLDPSGKTYVLAVDELGSFTEGKSVGSKNAKASLPADGRRIHFFRPDSGTEEPPDANLREAAPSQGESSAAKATADLPSLDEGRLQLNARMFAEAADTFTQILAARPDDSLSHRLRGNAYDNLGDRQKAVDDWTQAARLGDRMMQSYLDFLHVEWREDPAL